MYLRHVCVYFIAAGAVFASAGIAPKALEAFKIALRYHNSGDLQSASIHYRNALAHDPTLVSAAINLGIIHEKWHEPNEARKLYDESVQAAPQSFAARYNRGQFRQKQGDLAGARIDYEVASRLKKDVSIHINLAAIELNLFEKKRDMELLFAAEKNIGAAEALKSKSPALYFNRAAPWKTTP